MKEGSSYEELVDKVYFTMDFDRTSSTLKMTCKCLYFMSTTTCTYFLYEIKYDGSLKFALATIFNAPFVNAIDLYIEKVDLNYDEYPKSKKIPLSRPCKSPPSTQCTPLYNDPLQPHKFSGPVNEGRPLSLLSSASRPSRRYDFGGTSKKDHKSSQLLPKSIAGGRGGIDSDLDAEYRTKEEMDSEFDGINDNNDSDEGE